MADGDRIRVEFTETQAMAQKLLNQLEENLAIAEATGQEEKVARLKAKRAGMVGPSAVERQAPEIEAATAALRAEVAVADQLLATERLTLQVLRQQAQERLLLGSPESRLQRFGALGPAAVAPPPQIILPPARRTGLTAGEMLLADEAGIRTEERAVAAERLAAEKEQEASLQRQLALREKMVQEQAALAYKTGAAVGAGAIPPLGGAAKAAIVAPAGGEFTAAEQQLVRYKLELGAYDAYAKRASLSTAALTGNVTRLGVAQAEASQQMRAHGALTTEFIGALARGETTVQEFGYQIGATIGKFAGWTTAAAATYGALGAVVELGKGAIDGATAVGQLHRTIESFDTQSAQQALRALSQTTNVSLKEAGDATFLFSRSFHNVNDAVAAAQLGLSAYKLDQAPLADSVRALTALHLQYGLSVKQLGGVYDVLAEGQQQFNARMQVTIPFLITAAGAAKIAGTSYQELAQIGVFAARVTQATGTQLATAFRRSALTFVRKPAAQEEFANLGLPGQEAITNYGKFLIDTLQKARSFSPVDQQKLATALGGPNLGSAIFSRLISGATPALIKQLRELTPESTRGTLAAELAKELKTAREELEKLVNGLQRIGSALAQSDALKPLGLILDGLNGILHVVENVIEAFDRLPEGLKTTISTLVEVRLAMLALTRTQLGASVGQLPGLRVVTGALPGFTPSPQRVQQQAAIVGTRNVLTALEGELSATGAGLARVGATTARLVEEEARLNASLKAVDAESTRGIQIIEQINAVKAEQVVQESETAKLELAYRDQVAAITRYQTQLVGLQKGRIVGKELSGIGAQFGANTAATEAAASQIGIGAAVQQRFATLRAKLSGPVAADAASVTAMGLAVTSTEAAVKADAAASEVAAERISLGAASMNTARGAIGAARGALLTLGRGLTSFVGLMVGLPIVFDAISHLFDNVSQATDSVKAALALPVHSMEDLQRRADALNQAANKAKKADLSLKSTLPGVFGNVENVVLGAANKVEQAIGVSADAGPTVQHSDAYATLNQALQQIIKNAEEDSKTVTTLHASQVAFQRDLKVFGAQARYDVRSTSGLSAGEATSAREAVAQRLQQLRDNQRFRQLNQPIAPQDPFRNFRDVGLDKLVSSLQAFAARAQIFGTTNAQLKTAATLYQYIVAKYRNTLDPKLLGLVSQGRDALIQAIQANVQDLINQAGIASSKGARVSLLNQAKALLISSKAQIVASQAPLKQAIVAQQAAYDAAVQTLAEVDSVIGAAGNTTVRGLLALAFNEHGLALAVASKFKALDAAKKALAAASHASDQIFSQLDQQLKQINTQTAAALKVPKTPQTPASQDPFELTRLQSQLEQARAEGDPVKQARIAESLARQEISAARNEHERLQAMIDLVNAENTLNKAIEDNAIARLELLASRSTDPVVQAKYAVAEARKRVQFDAAHGGLNTTQALTDRASLNKAIQDQRQQIASAEIDTAKFEYDIGRITEQQYIAQLQKILKLKHLALATRRQLQLEIYNLQKGDSGTQGNLDLGSIRLPTVFEIRRAVQAAQAGISVTQNYSTTINAPDVRGANQVGVVMDRYHRGTGKAIQRAQGLRAG